MRRQYHFRKIGDDTHIWDVHRLVELTRAFPVKKVALAGIQELNEAYCFQSSIQQHNRLLRIFSWFRMQI